MSRVRLVVDWDGTVTERDSLWMVLDRFGDPEVFARVEGALTDGRLSFREVMELEFATVTAPLDDVREFLLRDPRLAAAEILATPELALIVAARR